MSSAYLIDNDNLLPLAIAKAVGSKIYCDQRKKGILLCQTDPELHSMLTSDPIEAQVHLLPLGNIQLDRLQSYLTLFYPHFDRVLGFRPTGWSYSPPAGTDMLPDVNTVIRRDQARRFGEQDLKTMRGSSRNFMMYGKSCNKRMLFFLWCSKRSKADKGWGIRGTILGTLEFL